MNKQTCERCGRPIEGRSIDLWALITAYDENGEVCNTGEQIDWPNDYIVIGEECCGQQVEALWTAFTQQVYTATVYDIGITIPEHYTDSTYDDMSQFLEEVKEEFGLKWVSSGCGFGVRDAQLKDTKNQGDLEDEIRRRAAKYDLDIEYVDTYKEAME